MVEFESVNTCKQSKEVCIMNTCKQSKELMYYKNVESLKTFRKASRCTF